jgi:hypothetical protein
LAAAFQAEYEGSIPFTRSRSFPVNLNLGGWPRSAAGKTSLRWIDSEQVLGHPLGAREMAIKSPSSALNVIVWIDVQYDPRNFTPVGTFLGGIQYAQIGVDVFFVVGGDYRAHRSNVGQARSNAALRV